MKQNLQHYAQLAAVVVVVIGCYQVLYLISRSSSLPLLLIVLGVFGGIIAFGFIGIFIGPPMLAVGLTLIQLWTSKSTLHIIRQDDAVDSRSGPPS